MFKCRLSIWTSNLHEGVDASLVRGLGGPMERERSGVETRVGIMTLVTEELSACWDLTFPSLPALSPFFP